MQIINMNIEDDYLFIYDRLKNYIEKFSDEKLGITINEEYLDGIFACGIGVADNVIVNNFDKFAYEKTKYLIAQAICNVILDWTKEKLIYKLVDEHYYFLDKIERQKITAISQEKLNEAVSKESFSKIKYYIIKRILEYLDSDYQFNFEGFVRFRLKEYLKEVVTIIDYAATKYFAEREYHEFVNLLKYFLKIQDSMVELVHVVALENDYNVLDDNLQNIQDEIYNLTQKNFKLNLTKEDLLLSRLISISPKRLIIHNAQKKINDDLLTLLEIVFEKRLTICENCDICKKML